MVSIIIYTTGDVLLHKQGKLPNDDDWSESGDYYWELRNLPKRLEVRDKIYFAVKGYIRGYFIVTNIDEHDSDIEFNSDSWKDIEPIIQPPFQGFKYADKVEALKEL